jgi:hypothetical protein
MRCNTELSSGFSLNGSIHFGPDGKRYYSAQ